MKRIMPIVAMMVLLSVLGPLDAEAMSGPPRSPLSWKVLPDKGAPSSKAEWGRRVLGVSSNPVSVENVDLHDEHSFGEETEQAVWLARFDSVRVQAPDGKNTVSITLLMAFDMSTNNLVCAFTEPLKQWAYSTLDATDPEVKTDDAGWEVSPARYATLTSTVLDLLEAAWKQFGVDPSKTGQVIIRPRFVANKLQLYDLGGKPLPRDPPTNVWIVEALGSVVMQRRLNGLDRDLTTLIMQFRDGDLQSLRGMIGL